MRSGTVAHITVREISGVGTVADGTIGQGRGAVAYHPTGKAKVSRDLTGTPEPEEPWDRRHSRTGEPHPPVHGSPSQRPPQQYPPPQYPPQQYPPQQGPPQQYPPPQGPRPPGTAPPDGPGHQFEAPRIRYTPTVNAGGPPQPWPEDRPGYEFDGAFPLARRRPPRPRPAELTSGAPGTLVPRAGSRQTSRPAFGQANAEWARLLRSLLPVGPARPSFGRLFLANLHFRGWVIRVMLPVITMMAVGIAAVVVVGANSGAGSPAPSAAALGFPPATLASGDFTAAASTRGISQSLGRIASDGNDVVAVGGETGALIPRAEFFFSPNGGGSWSLASESALGGGVPPPGHPAQLVAGGQGGWVALGPDAIWTSGTGQAWTLVSTAGLPAKITVLRRTGGGFIAAGPDALFASVSGTNWQRLAVPAGAIDVQYVAAAGNSVLLAAEVPGGLGGAWLSTDGGQTWIPVPVPRGHDATDQIAGVAATGTGFVLVRPAVVGGRPTADVYRSPDGATWTFAAMLGGAAPAGFVPAGFVPGVMNGGAGGAVITGKSGGTLVAFVSADGIRWRKTLVPGGAESVAGAAMTGSSAVLTATGGSAGSGVSGGSGPQITTISPDGAAQRVSVTSIPGVAQPQLAVNAVDAQGSDQVAVGSANGYPAAWVSTDGGSDWNRAVGASATVLERPGEQQLTSVAYGAAGWLAVGGVTGGTAQHPVVIGSADGSVWTAADGEPAFAGSGLFTEQAAAGPNGYVIVGYQRTGPDSTIAAAWWSAGLTGWQRASAASVGALDGESGSRQMLAVTAAAAASRSSAGASYSPGSIAASGGFVAVGLQGNSPAAWTSPDGKTWTATALPLPAGAARAVLLHVAAVGGTMVAVGMSQTASGALSPFAARSADGGATWTESALPVPSGVANVTALAAAGGTFTATGTFGTSAGHQDVVVWTSSDGATWTATTPSGKGLAGPGIQAITGLTVSGSTLTGVGFTATPQTEEPVFWQSPIR
jgi:hypothetical protein